jgi:hypothetical protein
MLLLEPANGLDLGAVLPETLGVGFGSGAAAIVRPLPAIGIASGHAQLAGVEAPLRESNVQATEFELSAGERVASLNQATGRDG